MENVALSGITAAFLPGVPSQGTTSTTSFTAVSGAIRGYGFNKAASANLAGLAAALQATGTTCLYLFQVTAAGVISVKKSDEEVVTPTATNGVPAVGLQWPRADVGNCPIGGVRIRATAPFTHGTTTQGAQATFYGFAGGYPADTVES